METEQRVEISFHKPSIKEKIFFLVSGLIVSVPFTVFLSEFSDSLCVAMPLLFAEVCSLVVFAPFIEELAKVFPLFYRHGETERSILNLGILVGLGFGVTEFALYVFALGAPFISRVAGVIFHASSTGITAYGIAKKKPIQFYLIAVAFHLTNNLFALFSDSFWLFFISGPIVLISTFLLVWHLYRRTSETIVV
ncbi:MAG: PrsW family intramembrane metalloprotease [Candidatus Bathyarchaeota archaeon]|nr:MAG: PrsW family intramembrane metalloprotease [Candidatus Bathyarchaeota archaeon]